MELLKADGIAALEPAQALELLGPLLGSVAPAAVAVMPSATPNRARLDVTQSHWHDEPVGASVAQRDEQLRHRVCVAVASVLRQSEDGVVIDRPLREQGLDSLMSTELRDQLEQRSGLPLPRTLVWQYPTVVAIAEYLASRLSPAPELSTEVDQTTDDELRKLLTDVEQLTDAEVQALLDADEVS